MKSKIPWSNLLSNLIIVSGLGVAIIVFKNPQILKVVAPTAITALSIIFSLSAGISALANEGKKAEESFSNDRHLAKTLASKAESDDQRTLARQKHLTFLAILTVIFGLIYITAVENWSDLVATKFVAALFGFGSATSFLFTLYLPSALIKLVARNRFLTRSD